MDENRWLITDADAGRRIDSWIRDRLEGVSRSHLQKMIERKEVLVNGQPVKSNYRLKAHDKLCITVDTAPEAVDILPQDIPIDIIYEDDDLLIINKPKGMVVHPAAGHWDGTLVNAIMYHCRDRLSGINGQLRPGIVHRIDKDTTGSLVICKNDRAHILVADQIAEHSIRRSYEGIVLGSLPEDSGTIDAPIGRDPRNRKRMAIERTHGKPATTRFRVLERFKDYTYARFDLETGRTHQIRVHMASLGHPLLGDEVYGPKKCPFRLTGQTLHAKTIGLVHPSTGEYMEWEAPLPDYFTGLLGIMRKSL